MLIAQEPFGWRSMFFQDSASWSKFYVELVQNQKNKRFHLVTWKFEKSLSSFCFSMVTRVFTCPRNTIEMLQGDQRETCWQRRCKFGAWNRWTGVWRGKLVVLVVGMVGVGMPQWVTGKQNQQKKINLQHGRICQRSMCFRRNISFYLFIS